MCVCVCVCVCVCLRWCEVYVGKGCKVCVLVMNGVFCIVCVIEMYSVCVSVV